MFVSETFGFPWTGIYGKADKKYYDITTDQPVIFDGEADVDKYPWYNSNFPENEDEPTIVYVATDHQARWVDFLYEKQDEADIYICENRYRELIIFFFFLMTDYTSTKSWRGYIFTAV